MARATRITRPRLTAVTPVSDYALEVCFADGSGGIVSLKDSVFSLPGLAPLRDPEAFSAAVLGEYGWEAEWPRFDIQIGADTLFADMLDQHSQTPADRFTAWRIRNGLSLAAAGRELGVTVRTVSAYGSGARPIPRTVELACIGWEEEQRRKSA
nr:DUF2442 domain-containing protein [Desulfuromonas acetexigens]